MNNKAFEYIVAEEFKPGMVRIILNRPSVANAMNQAMGEEIADAFQNLGSLFPTARVALLTGSGHKAFCSGADLKERSGMDVSTWEAQHHAFEKALKAIVDTPIPVIAVVNGAAYAGGLELALACDFIYADDEASFAFTEVTLGIMPGLGGTQRLPRAVGSRRAREILFSGKPFSAQQAHEWGMVNEVFPTGTVLLEAAKSAERISANAPLAIREIKFAVSRGMEVTLDEGRKIEHERYSRLISTKDRTEGINAFNEKRKPVFKGE